MLKFVALLVTAAVVFCTRMDPEDGGLETKAEVTAVVRACSQFTTTLYQTLRTTDGNLFISPLSMELAIAVVYVGAGQSTAVELRKAMFFPSQKTCQLGFYELLSDISSDVGNSSIGISSQMFIQIGTRVMPAFQFSIYKFFGSGAQAVNFRKQGSAEAVSQWVREMTRGATGSMAVADMPPGTNTLLTSVMYLKSSWEHPFRKQSDKSIFTSSEGVSQSVQMMSTVASFCFRESKKLKAKIVAVPFKGRRIQMWLIIPDSSSGLARIEDYLLRVDFKHLPCEKQHVKITVPVFIVNSDIHLRQALQKLGLTEMFDKQKASMLVMSKMPVIVGDVLQKTYLSVDTDTNLTDNRQGAPTGVKQVTFDHPFIFVIRDDFLSVVLTIGRMEQIPEYS